MKRQNQGDNIWVSDDDKKRKKTLLIEWFQLCPNLHKGILTALVIILLFLCFRGNQSVTGFIIQYFTNNIKLAFGYICGFLPFSVAELFCTAAVLWLLWFLGRSVWLICRGPGRLSMIYQRVMGIITAALFLYSGICVFWGINYYVPSLSEQTGVPENPVAIEELCQVTALFARKANETSGNLPRDEKLRFAGGEDWVTEVFSDSQAVYENLAEEFPVFEGYVNPPKKIFFSRVMSILNFTGVYFPFTGESNLNMETTKPFLPATVAHELAHQKSIAPEQEANFAGIAACVTSGINAYEYSGWLLGYVYLGNALYEADYEKWVEISETLNQEVRADLIEHNEFWMQFETPVSSAAEGVYSNFLQGYGQELGMKSYGACVDLLVGYFKDEALAVS